MSDSLLYAASEAAECWPNTVSLITEIPNVAEVYRLLIPTADDPDWPCLQTSFAEHGPLLKAACDRFAAVSDGPIAWETGRGRSAVARSPEDVYPERWSSAHEAALGIAGLTLDLLVTPLRGIDNAKKQSITAKKLLESRAKALRMTMEEVADLQERIRRERAKVCPAVDGAIANPKLVTSVEDAAVSSQRLIVDLDKQQVVLDGVPYDVRSNQALHWLLVLSNKPGQWVSGADLKGLDDTLDGIRTDKVKRYIPDPIRALIESATGRGSRLNL